MSTSVIAMRRAAGVALILAGVVLLVVPEAATLPARSLLWFGLRPPAAGLAQLNPRVDCGEELGGNAQPRALVQSRLEFQVRLPTYLPAGYCGHDTLDTDALALGAIDWDATGPGLPDSCTGGSIILYQNAVSPLLGRAPPARNEVVALVSGAPATFTANEVSGGCRRGFDAPDEPIITNALRWHTDDVAYTLRATPDVPLAELLRVAGSLQ